MRVLLTTDTVGGVWTFTRELTEGLLTNGHAVALISFGREPSMEQQAWVDRKATESAGNFCYEASSAPLEWMQNNEQAFRAAAPVLMAIVQRFKPDVVHSNQFCFGSLPISLPKVVTAHSDVLSWADACRFGGLEPSAWLDRYTALVQGGLEEADVVVAPTRHMLSALRKNFAVPCETRAIPNGRSLPACSTLQPRFQQAVSVGRLWDKAKGLSTLLDINSPVPVLIAGEEQFEEASAGAGSDRLKMLGVLTEEELIDLFQQSRVYIAASHYEPFGLAPLEAALCGCAVLARNIPTLREVWGDAALYFRTAAELEQRLQALFNSPACMQAAQIAAKQRAEKFTAGRMTSSYLAIYEALIERAKTATAAREELAFHAA